jgi:hypothetical protein
VNCPHSRHVPLKHSVPPAEQGVPTLQQGSPTTPHDMQVPLTHVVSGTVHCAPIVQQSSPSAPQGLAALGGTSDKTPKVIQASVDTAVRTNITIGLLSTRT